jgi:hypothetical protein
MFLTKREHDRYMSRNDDVMLDTDDAWIGETDDACPGKQKSSKGVLECHHVVP